MRRVLTLVATLSLAWLIPAVAFTQGTGAVEGQVVNGTRSGSPVASLEVTLTAFLKDAEESPRLAQTDAQGRFHFPGLSTESDYSYQVSLSYQGAEYTSQRLRFAGDELSQYVEMVVYDSTASDEALKVAWAHTIVSGEADSLSVTEYLLFVNESNQTYIGFRETADGRKETLRFSLPTGATELQFSGELMDCCVVRTERGFSDTMAVFPGTKEVAYAYRVNPSARTYAWAKSLEYPTDTYDILIEGQGISAISGQLATEEPVDMGGALFQRLSGQGLPAGASVEVRLSLAGEGGRGSVLYWMALGFALAVAALGLGYLGLRRRLRPALGSPDLEPRERELLQEMARLDDDFEAGRVPEEVYRRARAEKKAELVELMRRSRN